MPVDVDLGPVSEVPENKGKFVAGPIGLAVFRVGDEVFAFDDACPHRGGPLCEGNLRDGAVYCPLHAWGFDLRTGAAVNVRNSKATVFPVRIEGGRAIAVLPDGLSESVDPEPWLA